MKKYSIGLDFGTLSVRALLVDIENGQSIASSVFDYPHGVMEESLPNGKKLPYSFALQDPYDYLNGLIETITDVMKKTNTKAEQVVGIGVDFTSSTIMPVKNDKTPLCHLVNYKYNPHAYVKLWKHHGGEEDARLIEKVINERNEEWINAYGGIVSSEWMLPKVVETLRCAPKVYANADRFMEALDWIIWLLTDKETRSACGAGYKMFYYNNQYPSKDFFKAIDERLENFVEEKLAAPILPIGSCAGYLTEEFAEKLGLMAGTPIATGIIDAHSSLVGAGVYEPGEMMIIVGTSSCHMTLADEEALVPGIGGIVKDGIIPGFYGYEGGQCCVGDHFDWVVKKCVPEQYHKEAKDLGISIHTLLCNKLEGYKAGQSGLLALDWFNGVRTPLMDFNLNGMILGMNLLTKPEEIYMSLIEATAFGTRLIIEQFEKAGVNIDSIILSGGIPNKNEMLVQVYSDVCNRKIMISDTDQASAQGAAFLGMAAASQEVTGYNGLVEIVSKFRKMKEKVYVPNSDNVEVYNKLYEEYKTLSVYFSKENNVMKRLNKLRQENN